MTRAKGFRGPMLQGALLALALLAVVIRVAVPPGFMADPTGGAGLVLCTGYGPVHHTDGKHDDGKTSASDMPCAFAGHAAAPAPDAPVLPLAVAFIATPAAETVWRDQTPGRGLAAPPPPSLGPPTLT